LITEIVLVIDFPEGAVEVLADYIIPAKAHE